ncbi:stomatin-like protein [Colwellia sp. 1_MG-2023]|uniref:SPFH domain-containing protein n=1 Tax=unclassified Colwellia TaxID=196834 RepID=UPI001C09F0CB|nr:MULTISPECIES: stomatin-like protein [unclassified Colwellia]MBU2923762.1 paraslipin [Colwellia sp. C2M11]MDO6652138.1 stomatin-like protein [Colwellia sp. 3_MG-2023]MDO6664693.1 stomatin-like protein [Colwellia sp. 2_MG-2023]MDO6689044.1 stomatin-like protein [Colwellia sp. 1_MG-2023]
MPIFEQLLTNPILWLTIVILYTLKKGIYFVPQNRGYVIYTLGKYNKTLSAGLNFIIPFVQSVAADRNLKEQSLEIISQAAITKDNITLEIDGILFLKVIDAAAATNNITDYKLSVTQLAMTTMRNAIGSMELDECFQNRDMINAQILNAMTEATAPWGVMVTRYEIKDIMPPQTIREDMEKQMTAEREKRSVILTAEGVKTAAITEAEGHKQARVLDAEAAKAEQVLAAEASKESQVLMATGKAEAIRLVAEADASALEVVGSAANTDQGKAAVTLTLAQDAISAHQAIASESTVVLTDGKTGDNIANTVAQAIAVSSSLKLTS